MRALRLTYFEFACAIAPSFLWWTDRDSNPDFRGASAMCSHCHYQPRHQLPGGTRTHISRLGKACKLPWRIPLCYVSLGTSQFFIVLLVRTVARVSSLSFNASLRCGGVGGNRTLNFWLQARCVPVSTTTPGKRRLCFSLTLRRKPPPGLHPRICRTQEKLVGRVGFEPTAPWFQTRYADQTALPPVKWLRE